MKLASIEIVLAIEPIANADKIVLATIQGWQAVIKKDEFNVGDEVVFIPVDTILQRAEWNEFLFKDKNAKEIRLKTVKLRGVYSQGLILPIEIAGYFAVDNRTLAEMLGVTKYEKPLNPQLAGQARGGLPSWLRKSDEENLQSNPLVITELQALPRFLATMKMDGSSFKCYLKDGEFGVCSRSLDLKETDGNTFWQVARQNDLEVKLRLVGRNLVICGEVCGPGIQKNPIGLTKVALYVYDIWDIGKQEYLPFDEWRRLCNELSLNTVPVIQYSSKFWFKDLKETLDYVNGAKYADGIPAEGVVFRCPNNSYSKVLRSRLSVKVINQNYKD